MKRIIYIIICLLGMNVMQAQDIKERIQVQTDKDFYLAGENMGLKLYATDAQGKALPFSRVAYVELLGDKDNAVRLKVELKDATGNVIETVKTAANDLFSMYNTYCWAVQHGILN